METLPINPDQMYDTEQTAKLVGRSVWVLLADRKHDRGIPFCRLGRSVRYRASDISAYLDANRVIPGQSKEDAVVVTKPAPAVMQDPRSILPHLRGMRGFH